MTDSSSDLIEPRDHWYVLGMMTMVYALNIADRFSISTLIEPIRQELRLSDSGGVAFLTGVALAMFYVTVGMPVVAFADRANRRNIIAAALVIWPGMTAMCGLAQNYRQLLLVQFAVGIGEAGRTPPSTSILADMLKLGQLRITVFEACSTFICITACILAESPSDPLHRRLQPPLLVRLLRLLPAGAKVAGWASPTGRPCLCTAHAITPGRKTPYFPRIFEPPAAKH
jgi:hypothetical protein